MYKCIYVLYIFMIIYKLLHIVQFFNFVIVRMFYLLNNFILREYIAINNNKKDKKGIRIYLYDTELVVFVELIVLPDCVLQRRYVLCLYNTVAIRRK